MAISVSSLSMKHLHFQGRDFAGELAIRPVFSRKEKRRTQMSFNEVSLFRHWRRGFDCNVEVVTGDETVRFPHCFQMLSHSTTCGGERGLASWQTGCITG
jgi:hypothetical protein